MSKHIVYAADGTTIIKEIDIEKDVTLEEMRDVHGLTAKTSYRLRSTSGLSPAFTIPAVTPVLVKPSAAGAIGDQTWTAGSAVTLNVAADFSGSAPITYTLASGSAPLPTGLNLSSSGLITGIPTKAVAKTSIVVRASNSVGSDDSAFSVTVAAAVIAPNVTEPATISPANGGVGAVFALTEGVFGGTAITIAGALTLDGVDVTAQMSGLTYMATAAGALVWTVTASNSAGSISSSASAAVSAESAGITAISADEWQATYPDPPAFDPVSVLETVLVARQGFNAAAMPVTVNDTLTIMDRVREPYPSQTLLTTDKVSLSDYVYAGDVVSGAVNSSARPVPLPIAAWIGYDREIVKASTYPAKLAVAHAHARNGRPVAAIKFIATDGVTTVEQMASSMVVKTYAVTGLSVPHFAADLDLTGFANGSEITIDAVIYPWIAEINDYLRGVTTPCWLRNAAWPSFSYSQSSLDALFTTHSANTLAMAGCRRSPSNSGRI